MTNIKFSIFNFKFSILYLFLLSSIFYPLSSILFPSPVLAQSLSLSVTPPLLEVMIKPGKTVTSDFRLTNHSDATIVTMAVVPYDNQGPSDSADFQPEEWITLLNTDVSFRQPFLLKEGEEKQLTVKFSPPPDIEEKDYYRAVTFSTSNKSFEQSSQTDISQTITTIMLITVTSGEGLNKRSKITMFKTPKFVDSFGPGRAELEVSNTGNSYFRTVGNLSLTGPIGKAQFPLIPRVILAGQKRKLLIETPPTAQNDQQIIIPGFFLGKYTLQVDYNLDSGNIKNSQKVVFYAIPFKAISGLLTLAILSFGYIKLKKKKLI